jgi:hypothetical protein
VPFANATLLLVTLDKANKEDYGYEDRFEDQNFWWQSQNRQHRRSAEIQRIHQGLVQVHLFARVTEKRRGKTSKFVYCGRLANPEMNGDRPVTVLFDVADFATTASGELREIYDWKPEKLPTSDELTRESILRHNRPIIVGQGFVSDPRVRKAVEDWAMTAARAHYESAGYAVTDTSANRPYDYVATKSDDKRRIEVKGTQGEADSVIVTVGEVNAALQGPEPTDLFVLSGVKICIQREDVVATGGTPLITKGWRPEPKDLAPIQFRYNLLSK